MSDNEFQSLAERLRKHSPKWLAHHAGRRIPPPLNPDYPSWVPQLADNYAEITSWTEGFAQQLSDGEGDGKIHPLAVNELKSYLLGFQDAVEVATNETANFLAACPTSEDLISRSVNGIADHAKHVYAVGSRDISWMQYRLQQQAYAGYIEVRTHNALQDYLCYQLGDPLYGLTVDTLYDDTCGNGDWDDNTYSDGRQVAVRVRIVDWQALFPEVPRQPTIEVCGDGVINEHPEGVVCRIAPPTPVINHRFGYPMPEIKLADVRRQPWTNAHRSGVDSREDY